MALAKVGTGLLLVVVSCLTLAGCGGQQSSGLNSGGTAPQLQTEFTPDTLIGVADQLYQSGSYEQAIPFYQRAQIAAPADPRPLKGIGLSLAGLGMTERALPSLMQAVRLAPDDGDSRLALANIALQAGQAKLARENFLALAAAGASTPAVYNGLAVASDLLGDHLGAQANYSLAISLATENRDIRNNLALSFAFSGEYEAAKDILSDLQGSARGRQNLALVYGLSGDSTKARELAHLDLNAEQVERNLASYANLRKMPSYRQAAMVLIGRDLPEQTLALAP